jgi:putative oxidoreductase
MATGLLVLRIAVGVLFAAHGAQKLFGWFGGYGLQGTGGFFESMGFRPGAVMAFVAGTSELAGGLGIAAGLLTPLAAAAVIGVMLNAIATAKRTAPIIGGKELDLLYAGAATALAFTGAGAYSLDRVIGWSLAGWHYGVGALALAVVVGALSLASRRRGAPQAAEAPTQARAA